MDRRKFLKYTAGAGALAIIGNTAQSKETAKVLMQSTPSGSSVCNVNKTDLDYIKSVSDTLKPFPDKAIINSSNSNVQIQKNNEYDGDVIFEDNNYHDKSGNKIYFDVSKAVRINGTLTIN